jgi:hypothetical protein
MTARLFHNRCVVASVISALLALGATAVSAQRGDRPRVSLRAQPSIAVAPARVVLTAELQGGSDDFEEYYCPTIAWDWGDDTSSESSNDCEPFVSGQSQIRRRFTVEHTFRREGSYKVYFHMKRKERILGSASATIQIQPGAARPY